MIYPIGVRSNTRYRGPLESKKVETFHIEQSLNIKKLYATFTDFEAQMQERYNDIDGATRTELNLKLKRFNDELKIIRGE